MTYQKSGFCGFSIKAENLESIPEGLTNSCDHLHHDVDSSGDFPSFLPLQHRHARGKVQGQHTPVNVCVCVSHSQHKHIWEGVGDHTYHTHISVMQLRSDKIAAAGGTNVESHDKTGSWIRMIRRDPRATVRPSHHHFPT